MNARRASLRLLCPYFAAVAASFELMISNRVQCAFQHLRGFFGDYRALDITADRLVSYANARAAEKAAPATIVNELAALKRGFSLAVRAARLLHKPAFPTIRPDNVRKGFFERADFQALLTQLPEYLRAPITFAYLTGWRVHSEVLSLCWRQVDLEAGVVRLEVGTTKNREGREWPLNALPELTDLLRAQREHTRRIERETGAVVPFVFHREGRPIRDFRTAWKNACKRAGLTGAIPHDFRRTAVRNLERAGVLRSVAMKLVGHKTESVYRRYAIVCSRDLADGVAKLAQLYASTSAGSRAVLPFPIGTATEPLQSAAFPARRASS